MSENISMCANSIGHNCQTFNKSNQYKEFVVPAREQFFEGSGLGQLSGPDKIPEGAGGEKKGLIKFFPKAEIPLYESIHL